MLLFVWRPICREFEDRLIGVFTETRGDFCSQGPTHNAAGKSSPHHAFWGVTWRMMKVIR